MAFFFGTFKIIHYLCNRNSHSVCFTSMVLMVGFASVTEWDDEKGIPRDGVSVGCPLLSPNDFILLNQKMVGFKKN